MPREVRVEFIAYEPQSPGLIGTSTRPSEEGEFKPTRNLHSAKWVVFYSTNTACQIKKVWIDVIAS